MEAWSGRGSRGLGRVASVVPESWQQVANTSTNKREARRPAVTSVRGGSQSQGLGMQSHRSKCAGEAIAGVPCFGAALEFLNSGPEMLSRPPPVHLPASHFLPTPGTVSTGDCSG